MTQEEKQGALELTEQEELELRQLSELILETTISEELLSDIRELSASVLELVRSGEDLEYAPWGDSRDAWASFTVYAALDEILRDFLLEARDENPDSELEDRMLRDAAMAYGATSEPGPIDSSDLEGFSSVLEEKLGYFADLDELKSLLGENIPDFIADARIHGWEDPAAVEAATNFYLNSISPSWLRAIVEAAGNSTVFLMEDEYAKYMTDENGSSYPLSDEQRENIVQILGNLIESRVKSAEDDLDRDELEEEIPEDYDPLVLTDFEELALNDPEAVEGSELADEHFELLALEDDLSAEDSSTDTSDEGEWGVAEIDGEGEPEGDGDFALEDLSEHSEHSEVHHHHSHVHQILSEELRGLDDYDGEPADEREIATLALIAEGIVYTELSEILLQDLLAEADQLIRKSRLSGPEWWMTIEAAEDVADLISKLLSGEPWPIFAPDASDEVLRREGNAHQSKLKALAESYPLDPEPTEAEEQELTEDEYIANYDPSRWPSMGATVDVAIFASFDSALQVLLIERGNHPEKGKWALPGGFVNPDESLLQAALRELQEETGVELEDERLMEQIGSYGYPGRDRRGYIISTLYTTLLDEVPSVQAADDAAKARFFPVAEALDGAMELAFDHAVLLKDARDLIASQREDRDR